MEDEASTGELSSSSPPTLPLKTRVTLSLLSAVLATCLRRDGTVNRRVIRFFDLKCPANSNPVDGVRTNDVVFNPSRNLWFRVFVPAGIRGERPTKLPVIFYFHGGGFVLFGPDSRPYDALCRRISGKVPAIVVSVSYRLAPESHYPTQYEDGFDVLEFLDQNRQGLPEFANLSCCFLAGDSAGGNVAHHVATKACASKLRAVKIKGMIAIQPFFGGEARTDAERKFGDDGYGLKLWQCDWYWRSLRPPPSAAAGGEEWDRDHAAINVSGPGGADISKLNFPATLVVVSGLDLLRDRQKEYFEWLKRSGKEARLLEYPTTFHGFFAFPELDEATWLIEEMTSFVHEHESS